MATNSPANTPTGTSGTVLQGQGAGTALALSTATYPATTTANQLLYSSATNTIAGLATANSSLLVTSGAGVPSISSTIPNGVTASTQTAGDNSTKLATTAYLDQTTGQSGHKIPYLDLQNTFSARQNFSAAGPAGDFTSTNGSTIYLTDTTSAAGTNIQLTGNGVTTPKKFIRSCSGNLDIQSDAYATIFRLSDAGAISSSTWNGTAVGTQYGGTGQNFSASTGLISLSSGTASATQTPSVTSITLGGGTALANYVEGTWTPAIAFGGGSTGVTYSAQLGYYTRIGNQVFCTLALVLTNAGSDTGGVTITGLPFTSSAVTTRSAFSIPLFTNLTLSAGYDNLSAQVNNSSTTMQLYICSSTGSATGGATKANIGVTNTSEFRFQFFYSV